MAAPGIVFGLLVFMGTANGAEHAGADKAAPPPAAAEGYRPPKRSHTQPAETREAFARRAFALTDLVLARHIDPPTRQEMILGGTRALLAAAKKAPRPDLSRQISEVRTIEEFTALLDEIWPTAQPAKGTAGNASAAEPSAAQLQEAFLSGLLGTVPGRPYLVTAKEARAESQIQANRYVGLGIAVGFNDKARLVQVMKVMSGGPAELGGMKSGDLIEAIDHVPVPPGTSVKDVVERLRGTEGSEVTVRMRQPDSKSSRELKFVRLPVMIHTVHAVVRKPAGRGESAPPIGILGIDSITASTAQELRTWESKFASAGIKGVILDFRNSGDRGVESYHAAVLLADSLLDGAPLGKLRTRERVRPFTADRDCLFRGMPLAVLVNEGTGGAAESVAAALQDADASTRHSQRRATIIGQPTGGRQLMTTAIAVPGSDELLMLATGSWQRPNVDAQKNQRPDEIRLEDDGTVRSWRVIPDQRIKEGPAAAAQIAWTLPDIVVTALENLARDSAQTRAQTRALAQRNKATFNKGAPPKPEQKEDREASDNVVEFAVAELRHQLTAPRNVAGKVANQTTK